MSLAIPPRPRGAYRDRHERGARDAVDATMSCAHEIAGRVNRERSREARETSGSVADGQSVWSWHPLLVSSWRRRVGPTGRRLAVNSPTTVARRIRRRGELAIAVKTIAWGMPDVSGASAVNTRVHTSLPPAHTGLRVHWAPGIPRALCLQRAKDSWQTSGAMRGPRLRRRIWTPRHCEEHLRRSNPASSFAARWIASLALAMTAFQLKWLFEIQSMLRTRPATLEHDEIRLTWRSTVGAPPRPACG